MSNWVAKIREHSHLKWNYAPTRNNPPDLGSRGCELSKLCEVWRDGSDWSGDCKNWPEQRNVTNNDEFEIERKKIKELLATTVDLQNPIGNPIEEIVGLVTQYLYKATGKTKLMKQELKEVILDTEMNVNNRPLMYIDDVSIFPC